MSSTKHLEGTWCSGDLPFLITNGVRNGQRELWKLMLDLPCLPVLSPGHRIPVPQSLLDEEHTHAH